MMSGGGVKGLDSAGWLSVGDGWLSSLEVCLSDLDLFDSGSKLV